MQAQTAEAITAGRPVLLVVAAALVDADGRVLIAERPAGRSLAGLWEFPGGNAEAGESPETAPIPHPENALPFFFKKNRRISAIFPKNSSHHVIFLLPPIHRRCINESSSFEIHPRRKK